MAIRRRQRRQTFPAAVVRRFPYYDEPPHPAESLAVGCAVSTSDAPQVLVLFMSRPVFPLTLADFADADFGNLSAQVTGVTMIDDQTIVLQVNAACGDGEAWSWTPPPTLTDRGGLPVTAGAGNIVDLSALA